MRLQLYKRATSQLPEGCHINGFIPSWERGTLCTRSSPWMGKDVFMVTPRDWNKCRLNAMSELVHGTSWEDTSILCSLRLRTIQLIVPVRHPTGLALSRWCAMRDQEPALSGPWSGSAYWTQMFLSVMPRASLAHPCLPGPAEWRLGFRELG